MQDKRNRIIIVGAGAAGQKLLALIKKHLETPYQIIGFVDDEEKNIGKKIKGVPVLAKIEHLPIYVRRYRISQVFISIPSASGESIRRIIKVCETEKLLFKMVPRELETIYKGRVKLRNFKELAAEDMIGSSVDKAKQSYFKNKFSGKRILVTGGAGSIGSEVCRQLIQFQPKMLVAFDWSENGIFELENSVAKLADKNNFMGVIGNIQDFKSIKKAMHDFKPEIVFHTAAFKHVPLMQRHIREAIKNNVLGTDNVAKAAYEEGIKKFVNISTDKAADPLNIMGATKFIGERIVEQYDKKKRTRYVSVRFGNVAGSHGSVVPIFRRQIAEGGPLTVSHPEMTRYFMNIPEAVQLILEASIIGNGGETFVLDMGEPINIRDLAKLMITTAGFVPNKEIKIKYTGARQGEKVVETLISKEEQIMPTGKDRINKIIKKHSFDTKQIIKKLKKSVETDDNNKILKVLNSSVPWIGPIKGNQ